MGYSDCVIPTMWLIGAVIGRWWAVPLCAILWLLFVLLATHVSTNNLPLVAAVGAANAAVGVVLRQGVALTTRLLVRLGRSVRTH